MATVVTVMSMLVYHCENNNNIILSVIIISLFLCFNKSLIGVLNAGRQLSFSETANNMMLNDY